MNEFELIQRFIAPFRVPAAPFGPGDDAAVVRASPQSVVTTDTLVEGVHFLRKTFSLADIGHKALAVNLSDLASMGATPTWFLCALGLPSDLHAADLAALARGMAPLAKAHGIALTGGNVTRSPVLSLSITAAGTARRPLLRSGASAGELLCVSGPLGEAAAGLQVLRKTAVIGAAQRRLVEAQRRPSPHLEWGRIASRFATAAIDVSDGLEQDLGHLCEASGVRAELCSTALPISDELFAWAGSRAAAVQLALGGGEDYVVLASVPVKQRTPFERALAKKGLGATFIGALKPASRASRRRITVDGTPVQKLSGFMHFR